MKNKFTPYIPIAISFLILITGILLEEKITKQQHIAVFAISYLIVAHKTLWKAIKGIFNLNFFSEHFLMSIATIGAFLIHEEPEAVAVMLFYEVGELFQNAAVNRAKRSIKALLDIRPDKATVIRNGKPEEILPQEIQVGEIIQIKHGEKVALDGVLLSGKASFNTAALTGESIPDTKYAGEEVLAGMINLNTVTDVKVTKQFKDTKLSRILQMVQEATERKAKTQLFISRFAKVYTPIVVFFAIALTFLPYFFVSNYVFDDWLYRALVFLVASCPCALVISIPLGYFGGIGAASRNGILFKGSNYMDVMKEVKTVVMDKTGTLTKGVFKVQKVAVKDFDENLFLKLTAAVESKSTHPIANAITQYAGEAYKNVKVEQVEEIAGHGLKAKADGFEILAGNHKLLQKFNISFETDVNNIAETIVLVAINGLYKGFITIADEIKEDSLQTIKELHRQKIKTIMLSGDKKTVTKRIADALGIDEAHGELLPEDKVKKMEEIQTKEEKTAFAGDGVNDAPVLALADVGIAMGALGSDAAIETADVVIQTDHPSKIVTAIQIAKQTSKIVWQNIIFSLGVKTVVLVLGAGGLATIWEAVFADMGVALLAIFNAMRVQRMKFILPLFISLLSFGSYAQDKPLTLDEAIKIALQNNPQLKSASLEVEQQNTLKKTAFELPKTNVSILNGQYNSEITDTYIGVTQDIYFPTVYIQQNKVQKQNVALSEKNLAVTQTELIRNVKSVYYQLVFVNEKLKLLSYQDSIYNNFSAKAELKYKTGESSYLEMLSAKNKYQEIQLQKKQTEADLKIYLSELQKLLNTSQPVSIVENKFDKLPLIVSADTSAIKQNPLLAYYNQKITLANSQLSLEKNKFLPDFSIGYFNQSLDAVKGFQGLQFGIGIPIFFWGQQGRVQSAKIQTQIAQSDYENYQNTLKAAFNQQLQEYEKYSSLVNYYESTGLKQADEILKVSNLAYSKGEIGYVEYIQNLTQAIGIKTEYQSYLNQYNQTVININYLTGK